MNVSSLEKAVEESRKILNPRYDVSYGIMCELYKMGGFEALHKAFNIGYLQGSKAAKAEIKN